LYTKKARVTVHLNNSGPTLCWQWWSPTHETLQVTHVTLVTQYQPLHSPHLVPVYQSLTLLP